MLIQSFCTATVTIGASYMGNPIAAADIAAEIRDCLREAQTGVLLKLRACCVDEDVSLQDTYMHLDSRRELCMMPLLRLVTWKGYTFPLLFLKGIASLSGGTLQCRIPLHKHLDNLFQHGQRN